MPLPFLKPRHIAAVIIAKQKPSGAVESQADDTDNREGLLSASEALLKAIEAKDASRVARALEDAFAILEASEEMAEPISEEEKD